MQITIWTEGHNLIILSQRLVSQVDMVLWRLYLVNKKQVIVIHVITVIDRWLRVDSQYMNGQLYCTLEMREIPDDLFKAQWSFPVLLRALSNPRLRRWLEVCRHCTVFHCARADSLAFSFTCVLKVLFQILRVAFSNPQENALCSWIEQGLLPFSNAV